jgi:hypothetical protein
MIPKSRDRRYSFIWIDKAGLSLAATVVVMFLALWLSLILAAGTAPTGRLSLLCLRWTTKSVLEAVFPVWFIARGVHAGAPRVAQAFGLHKKPVPSLGVVPLSGAA